VNEIPGNKVVIFPNPAGDYLMIKSEEEILSIRLFNSLGIKIGQIGNPGNQYKLEVADYSSGIYFIEIGLKDGIVKERVMIF
jgi:hypothetical protein